MWKIKNIYEADYGCEERALGETLKCIVCIENEDGMQKEILAADDYLTANHLEVGSVWHNA